jgi:urease accessory protein
VTIRVTSLLGRVDEFRFAGRRVVEVPIAWDEASRRRQRRTATDGTDLAIALERGDYLAEGSVLHDDGERVLVVARKREPALVVSFDLSLDPSRLVEQALALGHAFGNQHAPVEMADGQAWIPLLTSETVARATVDALDLDGATVDVKEIALGRQRPLPVGHAHSHEAAS